jgi:hypothetical protein
MSPIMVLVRMRLANAANDRFGTAVVERDVFQGAHDPASTADARLARLQGSTSASSN